MISITNNKILSNKIIYDKFIYWCKYFKLNGFNRINGRGKDIY